MWRAPGSQQRGAVLEHVAGTTGDPEAHHVGGDRVGARCVPLVEHQSLDAGELVGVEAFLDEGVDRQRTAVAGDELGEPAPTALGVVVDRAPDAGRQVEPAEVAPGRGGTLVDLGPRPHEPLRRQAQRQRAVGESAGHLQHLGAHRTDVDRWGDLGRVAQHRLVGPPVAGVGIAGRAAPGEQVLHGDQRLARAPHRRRRGEAGEAEEHVGPGAEAEEEASAGELLQGGGDHGDLRRMQRHRVEDARAEMDARRRRGDRGQGHHTRRVEDVVAEPDLVEARRLGLAGTRHRGVDAAGLARADAQTQFRSRPCSHRLGVVEELRHGAGEAARR